MIVEQYPLLTWGTDLQVESNKSGLTVGGLEPITKGEQDVAPDVFRAYCSAAASRNKGEKLQAPHIEFANANDDEKLTQFVQRFGPVVVSSLSLVEGRTGPSDDFERNRAFRVAQQDWTELHSEQQMFRAALSLAAELGRGKEADPQAIRDCISTILKKAEHWPAQWQREQQLRESGLGYEQQPLWLFRADSLRRLSQLESTAVTPRLTLGSRLANKPVRPTLHRRDAIDAGHSVICELANAFPPRVYPWGRTAIEAPHWDLSFGVRPVLYFILRREYLSQSGADVCKNTDCLKWFVVERTGQQYCSAECSRKHRQRKYWQEQGKELRDERRRKISKSGKVGQSVNKGKIKQARR